MTHQLAVVTGASKGIGEATAARFRREGVVVVGVSTSDAPDHLRDDPGVRWVRGDVGEAATWDAVRATCLRVGSAPSFLVLNAGRAKVGTVLDLELEDWQALFRGNFFGAVLGAKSCLPAMIAAGGGAIVVVSSVDGWLAEQGLIAYTCTKAALIQFARNLAVDHARDGIRVNVVAPGTTDTPAFRRGLAMTSDPDGWRSARAMRNPIGRILESDEVADAIWYLASKGSSGITGAVLTVDGGLTASYDFRNPGDGGYSESP